MDFWGLLTATVKIWVNLMSLNWATLLATHIHTYTNIVMY